MSNVYAATSLIGGGSGALDAIDGAILSDGDASQIIIDGSVYHYHLDATIGGSENSPYLIAPDNNPGTKRWVLAMPKGPFSHVRANSDSGQTITTGDTYVYEDEEYDDLGEYVAGTGIFTATYAGLYVIKAVNLFTDTWVVNETIDMSIVFSTRSSIKGPRFTVQNAGGANFPSFVGTTIKMVATETAKIVISHTTGGTIAALGGGTFNYLSIDRIA